MRAIAVLMVVLSHAGVPHVAGGYTGVDVFFVLSGFLITGLLVRSATHSHRANVDFGEFYARRARRILPAALITLVATGIAAHLLLNYVRAKQAFTDIAWATFFGANIHFAQIQTDYFARNNPPSPVQHFWTLAVEEQFYLVWPIIIALAIWAVGRLRRSSRSSHDRLFPTRLVTGILTVVTVASLAWSIYDTQTHPASAYFSTFARAWELGVGALLAIILPKLAQLPRAFMTPAGWIGVAGLVVTATTYSNSTPFPGYAALLPVAATALIIAAGTGPTATSSASSILSRQPLRFIGDISYSLYLWHWPLLTLAAEHNGTPLSALARTELVAIAFALSAATYLAIENPIRRARTGVFSEAATALLMWPASIVACMLLVLWGSGAADASAAHNDALAPQNPTVFQTSPSPGATTNGNSVTAAVQRAADAALASKPVPNGLNPPIAELAADTNQGLSACNAHAGQTTSSICSLGKTNANRSVVIVGNSHAGMWIPALTAAAQRFGWTFHPLTKDSCHSENYTSVQPGQECTAWFHWVLTQLRHLHPDLVIYETDYTPLYAQATPKAVTALKKAVPPKKLVLLGDDPGEPIAPTDCLLKNGATLLTCSKPYNSSNDDAASAIASAAGITFVNVSQWLCANGICPTVIGNTIAYIDTNHVSATYARQLSTVFAAAVGMTPKQP